MNRKRPATALILLSGILLATAPISAAPGSGGGSGDQPRDPCPPTTRMNPYKDYDGDGLNDCVEINIYETNRLKKDSDLDHLSDYEEVIVYGTDPWLTDTDGDQLGTDYGELMVFLTDPLTPDPDADGDKLSDGAEMTLGLNPGNPDTDSDGLLDWQDAQCPGLGGVKGYAEYGKPLIADFDGDGLGDYYEHSVVGTSGCELDSDGDGSGDPDEINAGTDPMDGATFP